MKISFSNVHAEVRQAVEDESKHRIEKLGRLLKHYAPDLVHLHGALEKHPRKTAYTFSLNLKLPTGTLHATGDAPDVRASAKIAFAEIEVQVKKHQQKLRKDYAWNRKRVRRPALPDGASAAD